MNIISKITKYLKKHRTQVKNIIILALVISVLFSIITMITYKSLYNEQIELTHSAKIDSEALKNQKGVLIKEKSELSKQIAELNVKIQEQTKQIESYKTKIDNLTTELENLKSENAKLNNKVANTTTYPDTNYTQSRAVWNHLKSLGLNDYVCAGILGNIMAEVGGQTLDISRWSTFDQTHYYGICQWAGGRKDRLLNEFGGTLEAQIKFLGVELFEVIPENNSFYDMQNEKEAALYFAKYYERCGSASYAVRQTNATKALEYFTA